MTSVLCWCFHASIYCKAGSVRPFEALKVLEEGPSTPRKCPDNSRVAMPHHRLDIMTRKSTNFELDSTSLNVALHARVFFVDAHMLGTAGCPAPKLHGP